MGFRKCLRVVATFNKESRFCPHIDQVFLPVLRTHFPFLLVFMFGFQYETKQNLKKNMLIKTKTHLPRPFSPKYKLANDECSLFLRFFFVNANFITKCNRRRPHCLIASLPDCLLISDFSFHLYVNVCKYVCMYVWVSVQVLPPFGNKNYSSPLQDRRRGSPLWQGQFQVYVLCFPFALSLMFFFYTHYLLANLCVVLLLLLCFFASE